VSAQNHDQVGNRAQGDRLSTLLPHEALKVAAMAVLLAPNLPLLFMGEEYGEDRPFLYFTDHGDPALQQAVREGRRAEFAAFAWQGDVPDPQDPLTFERSRLDPGPKGDPWQAALFAWYQTLIRFRKSYPSLGAAQSSHHASTVLTLDQAGLLVIHRQMSTGPPAMMLLGFNGLPMRVALTGPKGQWTRQIDSADKEFGGAGSVLPTELDLTAAPVMLEVPGYVAALYLSDGVNGQGV
jgi:maltooligosyltrehalose trehalohydrolase